MSIPDYAELYAMHEARQERELKKYPKCACCEEHITDDECYEINDELYCTDCVRDNFLKRTDDYVECE